MRHDGVRPEHPLVFDEDASTRKHKFWKEIMPDGSYKVWNNRTLRSGCGNYLTDVKMEGTLVYCDKCKEWFDIKQFKE